jgi:toxin-antitoxin system PIN domain toxin
MIIVDANILLYAYDANSSRHAAARKWLQEVFSTGEPVRLAWVVILAFLRLTTQPAILARPLSLDEAIAIVQEWLNSPNVGIAAPTVRHWEILRTILPAGQAKGRLVTDAHLAALAIEHGAVLYTNDRDFTRFPGLKWSNPLDAGKGS